MELQYTNDIFGPTCPKLFTHEKTQSKITKHLVENDKNDPFAYFYEKGLVTADLKGETELMSDPSILILVFVSQQRRKKLMIMK